VDGPNRHPICLKVTQNLGKTIIIRCDILRPMIKPHLFDTFGRHAPTNTTALIKNDWRKACAGQSVCTGQPGHPGTNNSHAR